MSGWVWLLGKKKTKKIQHGSLLELDRELASQGLLLQPLVTLLAVLLLLLS